MGRDASKNEFGKSVNEKPVQKTGFCDSIGSPLYNQSMTRRAVISRIRRHRTQLEKLGVKSLSIFGSVARGEERPDSDIDILVEFKGRATFDRYMDTKFYLE